MTRQPDIDNIYLSAIDPFLTNKLENVDLKHFKELKAFLEYSNDMGDFQKSIEEYNSGKKRKVLIVVGDMTADMISNKKNSSSSKHYALLCHEDSDKARA